MAATIEPARTLLYGRTSLDRSDGRSVDDQLTELREWAGQEGRAVVAEHRDDGISASRFARGKERPGWRAVLDAVDRGECDELALWEGSRGSRDLVEWVRLVDVCAERGVTITIGGRVHDPADPDDRERMLSSAVRADHESGRTAKRVNRGVRAKAADGRPHGAVNYGYRIVYVIDSETGQPVRDAKNIPVTRREPDPDAARIVREVVDRLLSGEPSGTVAADLNRRGVPSSRGAKWTSSNLTQMIRKPVYAGIRTSAVHALADDHPGTWAPIISRETHDRLIAVLESRAANNVRNGEHARFLLPGVARCGKCGDGRIRTRTRWNRPHTARVTSYGCADCFGVGRVAQPVDEHVTGAVLAFLSRPDVAEALADPGDGDRAEARERAASLRRKLADLDAALDRDEIDVAAYTRHSRSTRERLERAEADARPRDVPSSVWDLAGNDAAAKWEALTVPQRRAIVRALFVVKIGPSAVGKGRQFDPSAISIERRER